MAILHIYASIAILLLVCDHQDTESESCEIEMTTSQQLWYFFTFLELLTFLYYFVITNTPTLSNVKYKRAYIN